MRQTKPKASFKPWINEKLRCEVANRRKLERKWRKSNGKDDFISYSSKCLEVAELETSIKKEYFKTKFSTSDPKILSDNYKALFGSSEKSVYPKNFSGSILGNKFNHFFQEKVTNIVKLLPIIVDKREPCKNIGNMALKRFSLVTSSDINHLIRSGNNKCCVLDPLPTWLLKSVIDEQLVLDFIVHFINVSIITCEFPQKCKKAVVTPIYKGNGLDRDGLKSYRPVSCLPYLGKLLETVVINQLLDYMEGNRLFSMYQSGFRKKSWSRNCSC